MVPEVGFEPTRPKARDFKSLVSTSSTTRAQSKVKEAVSVQAYRPLCSAENTEGNTANTCCVSYTHWSGEGGTPLIVPTLCLSNASTRIESLRNYFTQSGTEGAGVTTGTASTVSGRGSYVGILVRRFSRLSMFHILGPDPFTIFITTVSPGLTAF